jgi:hypothetical protein
VSSMTLADLRLEVTGLRFNDDGDSARVVRWINQGYAELWAADNWTFRRARKYPTTAAGSQTLSGTPSHGFIVRGLWDENGSRIEWMDPEEFLDLYAADGSPATSAGDVSSGTPDSYTVIDEDILVGPVPATAQTWTMLYEKRITQLSADDDVPLLPSTFHYLLVPAAIVWGSGLKSDFTYQFQAERLQQGMEAMRAEYTQDQRGEPSQWGAAAGAW